MLCFPGSGGCLSEPQSLLCTGEVLPASPAFVPRGSSSSAHQSNPVRGSPARFSLSGERCRGLAASSQSEGNLRSSCVALCGPPLALVVHLRRSFCACWGHHHHRIVTTSLFASRTACTTCTGAVTTACSSRFTAATAGCRLLTWPCPRRSLLHHQWFSFPPSCRLPAPDPRFQRNLRPRRFWASGPAVRASSGSW